MPGEEEARPRFHVLGIEPKPPDGGDEGSGARLTDSLTFAICHVNTFQHRAGRQRVASLILILL